MVLTLAAGSLSAAPPEQLPATATPEASIAPPPQWLIRNTMRWMPLIERWSPDFPDLEHALVLAVIAQESQGFPDAESGDGYSSVGLMQVIPRSWTGTKTQLLNPSYNIYVGMRMLDATIKKAGEVRRALALYNCGEKSLDAGKCYSFGGYTYADRVLDYWLPVFQAELVKAGLVDPTPTTTPERVAPPKATYTPIPTSTETVVPLTATPSIPLATRTMPPSPTFTHTPIPALPTKEVVDGPSTLAVLTILLALFVGLFVTVRDWKRLGGR